MNWIGIQFLIIFAQIINLDTKAIDFVLVFLQADLDVHVYIELPYGMDLAGHGKDNSKYLLKLKKSLYSLKNASLNWHNKLKYAFDYICFWSLYQTHVCSYQRI